MRLSDAISILFFVVGAVVIFRKALRDFKIAKVRFTKDPAPKFVPRYLNGDKAKIFAVFEFLLSCCSFLFGLVILLSYLGYF